MKKSILITLLLIQFCLFCFFGSLGMQLLNKNAEIKKYKSELANYDKNMKEEQKLNNELINKIENTKNTKIEQEEKLNNLKSVKEITEQSIKKMKGQLGR